MKKILSILIIYPLITNASWWSSDDNKWTGTIYPDRDYLNEYKSIGEFKSLEECRSAALNILSNNNSTSKGDYECGLNCKVEDGYSVLVCDKTEH